MDHHYLSKAELDRPHVDVAAPIMSERIKALAMRAVDGAPALTAGEMRELAEAILEHQTRSDIET